MSTIFDKPSVETVAVALNRPLPEPLTYSVPPEHREAIHVGALVEVPLSGSRDIGCVVALNPPPPRARKIHLRPIRRIASPSYRLSEELIHLARWMAGYYFCTLGEALATVSMIGFSDLELKEKTLYRLTPDWQSAKLTPRQREAAACLAVDGEAHTMAELARRASSSTAIIRKLVAAGALTAVNVHLPPASHLPPADEPHNLLAGQVEAIAAVAELLDQRVFGTVLLHGITGSGKTEVYLALIRKVLDKGRTAICLVPEISLTPQTVDRFARRFQEEIGVFHSQLTRREKLVLYEKIQCGLIRLVIGARSAAFAPLPNLGLIIVDEEHESSYKQSESPRYQARDLSIWRASRLGIPVLLGSATPSLESYENARRGKYRLVKLPERPAGLSLPSVYITPMGKAAAEKPEQLSMLSDELRAAITDRLSRGEQTLLFLNRRGFSNFLMCPSCKWVGRCEDDDIVLTIHRKGMKPGSDNGGDEMELDLFPKPLAAADAFTKCHFCGRLYDYPAACPNCGESELLAVGSGTQRIEEALHRIYAGASILRLDQDVMTTRRKFLAAWQEMVSGRAQIILGTQMIAKGLHLERVTLVGVILAEVGLFIPDFRAEERTFSLLMQVAGRSGRLNAGQVILQTYMPHHPAIQLASRHDYEAFFDVEIRRREKMQFPPVQKLISITISDADGDRATREARQLGAILRRLSNRSEYRSVYTIGPRFAPLARLAGRHRRRILLRSAAQKASAALLRSALTDREWHPSSATTLTIDVDPQDLL